MKIQNKIYKLKQILNIIKVVNIRDKIKLNVLTINEKINIFIYFYCFIR